MPFVSIPEETFQRLTERAAALKISIEELVNPALENLARPGVDANEPLPLTGDAWLNELQEWKRDAECRKGRYLPGYVRDDSREMLYREREDAQL